MGLGASGLKSVVVAMAEAADLLARRSSDLDAFAADFKRT